ncbi:hydrogenase maturation protease [Candidatus Omnitrophota bacterium]
MIDSVQVRLKAILKGNVLIIGIGNTLKADDGFGSILAQRLHDSVNATVIDAKAVPENYINRVSEANADVILIIDVADFKGKAGEVKIVDPQELSAVNSISTHGLSLKMFIELLRNYTQAQILLLAVQPKSIALKEELSKELLATLEEAEQLLRSCLGTKN